MEFSPTPTPSARDYIDTVKGDMATFPDGMLLLGEGEYWKDEYDRSIQANAAGRGVIAGLVSLALHRSAFELVEFNKLKNSPAKLVQRSEQIREWYERAGQLLGTSRLLRALRAGESPALPHEGEGVIEESGVDIRHRGGNLASLAIHATSARMDSWGLTPHRRHRENWYTHEGWGIYIRATNPASPTLKYRREFFGRTGREFDSVTAFTLRAFLMARVWHARHAR